jgi:MFS family permease
VTQHNPVPAAQSVHDEAARFPEWRRNANAIGMGNLLTNAGWSAAFAFLPLVVKDMNTGNLELWVGIISFGYFCMSCCFTPVWGVLADHYGRKSMVLRAGLGMGVGFMIVSFVREPIHFLLIMMLVGLANGYVPAGQALVATNTPRDKVGGALASRWLGWAICSGRCWAPSSSGTSRSRATCSFWPAPPRWRPACWRCSWCARSMCGRTILCASACAPTSSACGRCRS